MPYVLGGLLPRRPSGRGLINTTTKPNTQVLRFTSEETSTSGFVGYDPEEERIVLAYAGTQPGDIQAWVGNVNGELLDYPKCTDCQVRWLLGTTDSSVPKGCVNPALMAHHDK